MAGGGAPDYTKKHKTKNNRRHELVKDIVRKLRGGGGRTKNGGLAANWGVGSYK